ncbi:hypothetical protein JCM19046_1324 [Bacillus sp. JCM 19046]|nr:hypothetical protein JCM19045_1951 [Bacillus sp. JCM 19045]GAF16860.1 hypothetical protein JCM19046_1324 [Bacillus sp. JCM 19046]
MLDIFMELTLLWLSVGLLVPIMACLAYENIRLHRIHVKMNRTVRNTDTTGRLKSMPLSPVFIRVRPKIPYFRDKSCQDDDDLFFVV